MTTEQEQYAHVFNDVAGQYARERPTYPDELVDEATHGLNTVLEIGCGTGQLTRALVARGLKVDALDPAPNMIEAARERVPQARYINARFEDFAPQRRYDGVFSASAFHWVDPQVSWAKAAEALKPGGRLALIQYIGLATPETKDTDAALEAAFHNVDPDFAATFPKPRDLQTIKRGIDGNVSQLWAWLGGKPVAVEATQFAPPRLAVVPVIREKTADEFIAFFHTTAFRFQLGDKAEALETETRTAIEALGGTARWAEAAVLVTAERE